MHRHPGDACQNQAGNQRRGPRRFGLGRRPMNGSSSPPSCHQLSPSSCALLNSLTLTRVLRLPGEASGAGFGAARALAISSSKARITAVVALLLSGMCVVRAEVSRSSRPRPGRNRMRAGMRTETMCSRRAPLECPHSIAGPSPADNARKPAPRNIGTPAKSQKTP